MTLAHVGDDSLDAQQRADDIHIENPLELRTFEGVDAAGAERDRLHHRRVVDQDVDSSETIEGLRCHPLHVGEFGDICFRGETGDARLGELFGDRFGGCAVEIGDDHTRTLEAEPMGVGASNTVAGPGDDDGHAFQAPR